MHNKSFTADNHVSIVGGRNIGNDYFGAGSDIGFADPNGQAIGIARLEQDTSVDLAERWIAR
jgi:cardiolipin synthase C